MPLPSEPGVYWFLGEKNSVLYVGKAKNLKNRITSYKQINQLIGKTKKLVLTAQKLKFKTVDSEIDALILEAELIKLHQPQFNILLKDDKSPLYLYVTPDFYPTLKTVRLKSISNNVKKSRLFGPYSSASDLKKLVSYIRRTIPFCTASHADIKKQKACFYVHLNLCPGVCTGKITRSEYLEQIETIITFLKGKKTEVIASLKKKITQYSKELRFEEANVLKGQIEILKYKSGKRFDHNLPILSQDRGAEMGKLFRRLLKKFYSLPGNYPMNRIEGYDISNIQGKWATGSMVVFTKGMPDKREYRKFKIKTKDTPDDPFMMSEMISRRITHAEWKTPNVILIDGGKTQLSAAQKVIPWNIPVVSLVKNPDRLLIKKLNKYYAIPLGKDLASNLLRSIRDESHRFAKRYHKHLTTEF